SAEQIEAVTLAGYEALANAATHAYAAGTGTLNLHAEYRSARRQVQIAVSDAGRWRTPPTDRDGRGGRGLVVIRSLAEHAEVHTDASGTTASMHWTVREAARAATSPAARRLPRESARSRQPPRRTPRDRSHVLRGAPVGSIPALRHRPRPSTDRRACSSRWYRWFLRERP